jgi:hypothetical protein
VQSLQEIRDQADTPRAPDPNWAHVPQFAQGVARPPQILRDDVWYFMLEFTSEYVGIVRYM